MKKELVNYLATDRGFKKDEILSSRDLFGDGILDSFEIEALLTFVSEYFDIDIEIGGVSKDDLKSIEHMVEFFDRVEKGNI